VSGDVKPSDKCVLRRSAFGGRTGSACAAQHTPTLNAHFGRSPVGPTQSHRCIRQDKMVLSMSCLVCRCELDDCSERIQTSDFLSVTVLSCRESSSHHRSGHDTDKTVLSCLAWCCELALTDTVLYCYRMGCVPDRAYKYASLNPFTRRYLGIYF